MTGNEEGWLVIIKRSTIFQRAYKLILLIRVTRKNIRNGFDLSLDTKRF